MNNNKKRLFHDVPSGVSFKEVLGRRKIREANLGEKNPMYGKPRSEETKRKIGEAVSKAYSSEEAREGLRERSLANYRNIEGFYDKICAINKQHYDDPKYHDKIRAALDKGTEAVKRHVVCDGVEYASVTEASNAIGHPYRYIKRRCDDAACKDWYFVEK